MLSICDRKHDPVNPARNRYLHIFPNIHFKTRRCKGVYLGVKNLALISWSRENYGVKPYVLYKIKFLMYLFKYVTPSSLPGPSRRLAPVLKCRRFRFFNVTLLGIYCWLRYIAGSLLLLARWNLIRHFEKHEAWRTVKRKIVAFCSPTFTMKLIENKSDLSKLSTLSESSIVKFTEN